MKRLLASVRAILFAALALTMLAAGWLGWRFLGTAPALQGGYAVTGPTDRVRIVRDEYGVPHVFGLSDADVAFGLGFAHAQDRIVQMDLTRRAMQGRLSEVFGASTLARDTHARAMNWEAVAQALLDGLSARTRALVDGYAAGVNAALDTGVTGPEFAVLLHRPERWRPIDTMLVALAMTDQLTAGLETDLARAKLSTRLPRDRIDELLAPYPDWAPRSFPEAQPGVSAAFDAGLDLGETRDGSNGWVVSAQRTGSGAPLLANDPHLPLSTPGPFYLARLAGATRSVVGATLPGAPFVVIGSNGRVAWGMTTTPVDAEDLAPLAADEASTTRTETIRVRTGALMHRTETVALRSTPDGPVFEPEALGVADALRGPQVLRSIADDPDNRLADALAAIAEAHSVEDVVQAVAGWTAPPQTIVAADVGGSIALIAAGRWPLREPATGAWLGDPPPDARLIEVDPPRGWLAAANNLAPPRDYPWRVDGGGDPFRIWRIARDLEANPVHDAQAAAALQGDVRSALAERLAPTLEAARPRTEPGRLARTRLLAWDGAASPHRFEPTVFAAWVRSLERAIIADELGPLADDFAGPRAVFLDAVMEGTFAHWCDDVTTPGVVEDCEGIAGAALDAAMADIVETYGPDPDDWRWGRVHRAVFANPVWSRIPLAGRWFDIEAPVGGDGTSVNVSRHRHRGGEFVTMHAAGLRMIADLSRPTEVLFQLAPGQSGHPASPHYRDLVEAWADNRSVALRMDWDYTAAPPGAKTLTLRPR